MKDIEKMAKDSRSTASSRFKPGQFKNADGELLKYQILVPQKTQKGKKYPLVLFLHGAGERGDDNKIQLVHGLNDFSSDEIMEQFPAFVVAPQCPKNDAWAGFRGGAADDKPRKPLALAFEMIDSLIESKAIDPQRIYITGLSMGGYGTWDAIRHRPNFFAAANPICGGGDSSDDTIKKIKHVPLWVVHGEADRVVPAKKSIEMVDGLKAAGANPKFTLLKGIGHNSWASTYRDIELYRWMFSQKRIPSQRK